MNKESKASEKNEFYVLPSIEENNKDNVLYNTHLISIPTNIYHELLGFRECQPVIIRTDIF